MDNEDMAIPTPTETKTTTMPVEERATATMPTPTVAEATAIISNEHVLQHFLLPQSHVDNTEQQQHHHHHQYYRLWSPSRQQEACSRQILANKFVRLRCSPNFAVSLLKLHD
jgi:hypothetical protein